VGILPTGGTGLPNASHPTTAALRKLDQIEHSSKNFAMRNPAKTYFKRKDPIWLRVFGVVMLVLAAALLYFSWSLAFEYGTTRLKGLVWFIAFLIAWFGFNCLNDDV
jgi:hypothetical protein